MSPTTTISSKALTSSQSHKIHNNGSMDEFDGRTRNAKAQKRHREKQKARTKALEESVQILSSQLDDARRQLGQMPFGSSNPRAPITVHSPEYAQLNAENQYLREENQDLRRQVYTLRLTYGGPPEAGNPADLGASPPLRQGSSHGHHPRVVATPSSVSHHTTSGHNEGTPTSTTFPGVDGFRTNSGDSSRTRVMSSSSAPSASPYLASSTFGDMRNSSTNSTATAAPPGSGVAQLDRSYVAPRYESYYSHNAPPPHALPRSQTGYNAGVDMNNYRSGETTSGGDNFFTSGEAGHSFAGSLGYSPVNFHGGSPGVPSSAESWRQHSH
ncbi:hypothetical protein, variant 5 [Cryptococcus amylolentus CBS 6039]|uniref:BZIP domain-containing protein n=1 Tax=Cryptococcus amylolentus CBS 6039 TaxID=1295533 RepID=A0A1E3I293_9TREE|nr:hypothetical protein, variant 3 [Cryptococcus amylolentus CBS 6039]XP_018996754.1 hypothetical protein, variant 4 [Cryptococcus amylolentus CBS 6039]XP_018996755.1 hypothetical protein, variant 5 [Cryptococcus amylolentus CBS 6039]ODN82753.1 hypothetical protein, variant 3 [Cryptococcus amylolentus CBS 6039]ODN82754.1 hypothetical protein, variant 4 [Cryptococcus amylolentus CBS 6039]ODN82755.1 hypothetical protein, variant 5 [Cryptococcus amylolentus CBS 6039]